MPSAMEAVQVHVLYLNTKFVSTSQKVTTREEAITIGSGNNI